MVECSTAWERVHAYDSKVCVFNEEFGLGWQDCQHAVTDEILCIVAGCVFGNRCMSLDV